MKIKTNEATPLQLNWLVAKCEGMDIEIRPAGACGRPLYVLAAASGRTPWTWSPSTSWHQGGEIIEREKIALFPQEIGTWAAGDQYTRGETPLIAAMRCYVALKLGDEVEIPEELKCGTE